MARTITVLEAPAAKPIGRSYELTDEWKVLADAPRYDIPSRGQFGSGREEASGAIEIATPLMVTNITDAEIGVDVQIMRADGSYSVVAEGFGVPAKDSLLVPVQGQFLIDGDELMARAVDESGLFATLSYTEGQAEEEITDGD